MSYPHELLDDPAALARYLGWSEEVYSDFLRVQRGDLSEDAFGEKYHWERAILVLDLTGFTRSAMTGEELRSLLRIFDAQKVCLPVLEAHGADLVRCFADDMVALFTEAGHALDAALEIHRRIELFNRTPLASEDAPLCCAGIGYGRVFAIGPNLAQGDEMNRASKLGEDIARANEILVTERARQAIGPREDIHFERHDEDHAPFPFFRVSRRC